MLLILFLTFPGGSEQARRCGETAEVSAGELETAVAGYEASETSKPVAGDRSTDRATVKDVLSCPVSLTSTSKSSPIGAWKFNFPTI